MNLQTQMKQAVAQAAVDQIQNGMILGLGSGSTAALMIESLAMKIKLGEIKDPMSLLLQVENAEIGQPFELEVLRNNKEINLSIKPAALPGIS